jgi:hypothetical protein
MATGAITPEATVSVSFSPCERSQNYATRNKEGWRMIPSLTLTDERKELEAQHMVCSYLVRACRQAMYDLALDDQGEPKVRHRAVQVLKVVHQDWLEAQKAIARELQADPTRPFRPAVTGSPKLRSGMK